jgi:hypothetical protein
MAAYGLDSIDVMPHGCLQHLLLTARQALQVGNLAYFDDRRGWDLILGRPAGAELAS